MVNISLDEYKALVKDTRKKHFQTPYDFIYDSFVDSGYDKMGSSYFYKNASIVVSELRRVSWEKFKPLEREFTSKMLLSLIDDNSKKYIESLKPLEAISWFIEKFPEYIYALILSNTQSRRSRAGKEFESIIELILIGAKIPFDSQGNIGKLEFAKKGLGKLVDIVSPGVIEYLINKRNTVLISAKTTLRERWQEVPEEMSRTGAREMFLATLDTAISNEVLNVLYEANIQVTTTRDIKNNYYSTNNRVLDFEKLLEICKHNSNSWSDHPYSIEEKQEIYHASKKQEEKHHLHSFVKEFYTSKSRKNE